MPHIKAITRIGNSAGLILDRPIMNQMGWDIATELEIVSDGDRVILTRHRRATDAEVSASAKRMVEKHRASLERLGR